MHVFFLFQAKALIVLTSSIAVYCTKTGESLWKRKTEWEIEVLQKDENFLGDYRAETFITKDIAGYVLEERELVDSESDESSDGKEGKYMFFKDNKILRIYATESGELLATKRLPRFISLRKNMEIKGPTLIVFYRNFFNERIHVMNFSGGRVEKKVFSFPIDFLIRTKQIKPLYNLKHLRTFTIGFLSKTNVLVGNLRIRKEEPNHPDFIQKIFTMDLDAILVAKNEEEVNKAFRVLSACSELGSPQKIFRPIYGTDPISQRVLLIGVIDGERVV